MKTFLIVFGVLFLIFIASQFFVMSTQKNIETYPYKLDKEYSQFEIRTYEARLFTAVKIPSKKYEKASRKGFKILANYIFGANEKSESIAMTSPVSISMGDSMNMMFLVPKMYDKESLPIPDNTEIKFNEEPAKTVAAISFSGWANDKKIAHYKNKLILALAKEGISYIDHFYFLGYNPPFEVFNRKNEIIVEIQKETFIK